MKNKPDKTRLFINVASSIGAIVLFLFIAIVGFSFYRSALTGSAFWPSVSIYEDAERGNVCYLYNGNISCVKNGK